ncbi:putative GDP-fucose protein O-fucosyltransferase [Rosa chinensis]|uniref:O-fucosyltransferase family protein n=1 Tax=Rosa chinensis TaxID=74649 RepID=A0A2P6S717_ROSCH|nr:O-fucosyltransferase 20 [Rosa chinensis]PRQ54476.1 putative GDP-fucose protein O-fucosyltransferase [Rosa chinensis]
MAKSKSNKNKVSYISVPSQIINSLSASSLQSLLTSPKKSCSRSKARYLSLLTKYRSPSFWVFFLLLFGILGMLKLGFNLNTLIPYSPYPCATSQFHALVSSNGYLKSHMSIASNENGQKAEVFDSFSHSLPLILKEKEEEPKSESNSDKAISDFWKQPDGLGYRPCLDFTRDYQKASVVTVKDRTKYLMVVVAGGLNQQRNQIVDAVVIARILGAALVVPILQVNVIWGDESEFSDIFDMEHFKKVLANDVRIVSSLPSTHIMTRPVEEKRTPLHVSPSWIRSRYLKRIKREGVLLLRGLDSRLSKDLPSDLQKLRCKVAFHALRFAPPILGIGNKLAERMRSKGPYLALHLRMEKDVWVRTGCLPGLSHEYDEIVNSERIQRPELLTARSNMTYHERKLAGLCPLNAVEVTRLLKALGAPKDARIYWAGGEPLGGREALLPLTREFSHFYNKEDLALPGELEPFAKRASVMAAIDYIVSENSDVFMPSHGGNMGHALQGQRAYAGHKKYITPDKRHMLPYFLDSSLPEVEFNRIIKELHSDSLGQPDIRISKVGRDVTKYPIPECMCSDSHAHPHL